MHQALEDRALTAMAAVEKIRDQADKAANAKKPTVAPVTPLTQAIRRPAPALRRIDPVPTLVLHTEAPRPPQPAPPPSTSQARKISFCPECGMRAALDAKFCAQCGIAIKPLSAAIARTE
jgi:hypothetical protein